MENKFSDINSSDFTDVSNPNFVDNTKPSEKDTTKPSEKDTTNSFVKENSNQNLNSAESSKPKSITSKVFKNSKNFIKWDLNYKLPKGMGTGIDFSKPKK